MTTFSAKNPRAKSSLQQQTKHTNLKMCQPTDSSAVLQLNMLLETDDVLTIELTPDETDNVRSMFGSLVVSEVSDTSVP